MTNLVEQFSKITGRKNNLAEEFKKTRDYFIAKQHRVENCVTKFFVGQNIDSFKERNKRKG